MNGEVNGFPDVQLAVEVWRGPAKLGRRGLEAAALRVGRFRDAARNAADLLERGRAPRTVVAAMRRVVSAKHLEFWGGLRDERTLEGIIAEMETLNPDTFMRQFRDVWAGRGRTSARWADWGRRGGSVLVAGGTLDLGSDLEVLRDQRIMYEAEVYGVLGCVGVKRLGARRLA